MNDDNTQAFSNHKSKDLSLVLHGYLEQTEKDFEIIIADDGSTEETQQMLAKFSEKHNIKINHVWHKDQGFQKTKILNKAILQSNSNYLLFTDGDCLPRKDLVKKQLEDNNINFTETNQLDQ